MMTAMLATEPRRLTDIIREELLSVFDLLERLS
jgi:hypothetical protein